MRQVNQDELTYQIYSGLRSWTVATRRKVFAPVHARRDYDIRAAAKLIFPKLHAWLFVDPARPYEVIGIEEISAMLSGAIFSFPGAIGALWLSGQRDRQKEAHIASAVLLADALGALEVLSEAELCHFGLQELRFPDLEAAPHALRHCWP